MRAWGIWLLAMASFTLGWSGVSIGASPQAASIEQNSQGACSSPIINNNGHISISCPGVAPEALHYLETQLSEQLGGLYKELHNVSSKLPDLNDSQQTITNLNHLNAILREQADDWAHKYRDLSQRLAESGNDSEQAKHAHDLIKRGEFAKAEAILEGLANKEEADVIRAAATQYDLGELAMIRFDARSALPHYEKAFRYTPDNPRYANGYARAADTERNYAEAERGWIAALQLNRELSAHDPGTYRPDVADTLNKLAMLYSDTGRLADADKAHSEALTIYRELAAHDPGTYQPYVADTLNKLAMLYSDTGRLAGRLAGRLDDADKAYSEALTIFRDLAAHDPGVYRPIVAATLNNLGNLYRHTGRLDDADKAYSEALTIFRDLAAHDPGVYRPDVATALTSLGVLYWNTGHLADADKAYSEALTIYRDLAAHNPGVYQPYVAVTLNLFGMLYHWNTGRLADADKAHSEALTIYRDLAAHDPGAYQPYVADTLTSLGVVYWNTGRLADAEKALREALTIDRDLASSNPTYASAIAFLTNLLSELRAKLSPPSNTNPIPWLQKS
jgi:tetratricopeptide (TPR) repeat protein